LLFDWSATTSVFTPVGPLGPYMLWRYTQGMGRHWIVHEALVAVDEQAAWEAVHAVQFNPREQVVLGVEQSKLPASGASGASTAADSIALVRDEPSHLSLRATLARPGWLVLARTWFPRWQVHVDGQPSEVLRANYAFQAVALDVGEHVVELSYQPLLFQRGLWIAALSVLIGAVCLWRVR
jgi:hypothetical protein